MYILQITFQKNLKDFWKCKKYRKEFCISLKHSHRADHYRQPPQIRVLLNIGHRIALQAFPVLSTFFGGRGNQQMKTTLRCKKFAERVRKCFKSIVKEFHIWGKGSCIKALYWMQLPNNTLMPKMLMKFKNDNWPNILKNCTWQNSFW